MQTQGRHLVGDSRHFLNLTDMKDSQSAYILQALCPWCREAPPVWKHLHPIPLKNDCLTDTETCTTSYSDCSQTSQMHHKLVLQSMSCVEWSDSRGETVWILFGQRLCRDWIDQTPIVHFCASMPCSLSSYVHSPQISLYRTVRSPPQLFRMREPATWLDKAELQISCSLQELFSDCKVIEGVVCDLSCVYCWTKWESMKGSADPQWHWSRSALTRRWSDFRSFKVRVISFQIVVSRISLTVLKSRMNAL